MTDTIYYERHEGELSYSGCGRLIRVDPAGPVILDPETGREMVVRWADVVMDGRGATKPKSKQLRLFAGDK